MWDQIKNEALNDVNGQVLIMCAHEYALKPTSTYVPTAIISWLKTWWGVCDENSKQVIIRNTLESLMKRSGDFLQPKSTDSVDYQDWVQFSEWAWDNISDEVRSRLFNCSILKGYYKRTRWPISRGYTAEWELKNV